MVPDPYIPANTLARSAQAGRVAHPLAMPSPASWGHGLGFPSTRPGAGI